MFLATRLLELKWYFHNQILELIGHEKVYPYAQLLISIPKETWKRQK